MRWFRFYPDILNNFKVQTVSPDAFKLWVNLLCFCSEQKNFVIPDDETLARYFRMSPSSYSKYFKELKDADLIINTPYGLIPYRAESAKEDFGRPSAEVWKRLREIIFKRDNYTCKYCGETGKKLECDHVVPVSKGGTHDETNLVTACFKCNRSKRDKLVEEWKK